MDVLTKEQRSRNMAAIRHKDTKPELAVRSLVYQMGFRYRLHRKDLPGKPDIVFSKRKQIIQVHGCFWHMHQCKYGRVIAAKNAEFWRTKRLSNAERDKHNIKLLRRAGWQVLTIWECWTRDLDTLRSRLGEFLS
jgi:DNA mismatch endonuclease, patch repair protein